MIFYILLVYILIETNDVFVSADGRVGERRNAESPVFGSAAERRWESEEVPTRELNISSQSCGERRRGREKVIQNM